MKNSNFLGLIMKNIILTLFISFTALSANANSIVFDHNGIQKGAVSESCYHNPCSIAKVMNFDLLESDDTYHIIKLNLVGGTRAWDSEKIIWNHYGHNIYVTCSLEAPTIQTGDQFTKLPINAEYTVPGVLYSSANLYLKTCHNFDKDATEAAKKYGYNITEDW